VGAQSGTMRMPAVSESAWLARLAATVWPGARLAPSSCIGLSQPSCQACGAFQQRSEQQAPCTHVWSSYLRGRDRRASSAA
jgi:hypothetical protein